MNTAGNAELKVTRPGSYYAITCAGRGWIVENYGRGCGWAITEIYTGDDGSTGRGPTEMRPTMADCKEEIADLCGVAL